MKECTDKMGNDELGSTLRGFEREWIQARGMAWAEQNASSRKMPPVLDNFALPVIGCFTRMQTAVLALDSSLTALESGDLNLSPNQLEICENIRECVTDTFDSYLCVFEKETKGVYHENLQNYFDSLPSPFQLRHGYENTLAAQRWQDICVEALDLSGELCDLFRERHPSSPFTTS